ncbi:MAG TPA: GNAT family protein [Gemmatimonadales bacterium]|nr:GNAT family protein [Gemmatimonadales bacterium]
MPAPRRVDGETLRLPDGRTVVLRHPEPDDAPAVLAYLRLAGGESPYLTFGSEGPGLSEAEEREFLARVAATDNTFALAALDGDRVVGLVTFEGGRRPRTRHTGELGISVAREYHGQGVGRALLERLIGWAQASGVVRKLDLRVRVDNAAAIRLYERLGFVVEGRIRRDLLIDGAFHDAFLMGRPIDPSR